METAVNPDEPGSAQSRSSITFAGLAGLPVASRGAFDLRDEEERARLRKWVGEQVRMPEPLGVYYLWVALDDELGDFPVLVPEAHACAVNFGIGLARGYGAARQVSYWPGMLPATPDEYARFIVEGFVGLGDEGDEDPVGGQAESEDDGESSAPDVR